MRHRLHALAMILVLLSAVGVGIGLNHVGIFDLPVLEAQAIPEFRPSDTINWVDPSSTAPLFYEVLVVAQGDGVGGTPVVGIANHTTTGVGTPTSLGASALFGPNVVSGTTYDFHIRGEDAAGNKGPWSAAFTITLINTDLLAPGGFTKS